MVLKRKLPTQEIKKSQVVEQDQFNDFDMSLNDEKKAKKVEAGHDINDDFSAAAEGRPEDFIPEELRALEQGSAMPETPEVVEEPKVAETPVIEEDPFETASFDMDDEFNTIIDEQRNHDSLIKQDLDSESNNFASPFEKQEDAPQAIQEEPKPVEEKIEDNFDSSFDDFDTKLDEVEETKEVANDFEPIVEPEIEPAFEPEVAPAIEPEENPVSFEESFDDVKQEESFESNDFEEKLEPQAQEEISEQENFEMTDNKQTQTTNSVEFENHESANWEEVVDNSVHKDENFDSFESIKWDDDATVDAKPAVEDDGFSTIEDKLEDDYSSFDNGGIVPELPGMSETYGEPAKFMSSESKDMALEGEAKKKFVGGLVVIALLIGGYFIYSNKETSTDVANRITGSITDANQDIAETKEEQEALINQGKDITEVEDMVSISDLDSKGNKPADVDLSILDDEESVDEDKSATEINILEAKVVEKTASGKEIIKATGEEKMPEEVKQGANLISGIAAELEKQKAGKAGNKKLLEETSSEEQTTEEKRVEDVAKMNEQVDDQLAEYRKLLAQEKDPGKKVKPGSFFSGDYKEDNVPVKSTTTVSKVVLGDQGRVIESETVAEPNVPGYQASAGQIGGHQIIEYPQGVARQNNDGIRTLDHFRSLIVEKEDKRVRMPKNIAPSIKNQGFPKFKVISIVPNYGLIGEYNNKKGILMIGDSFKGWELIGVYESYAEFKSDTRKHIISLR